MISRNDIERLLHRPRNGRPVLSAFLDMSVNAENKRTHRVFLNQQRAEYAELASDREAHHREPLGEALERVESWLDSGFDEANKGVAVYAEIGGDWFHALQFPVPVKNRLAVTEQPIIGPLAQIVESYRHHGVVLVDRENLRLLSVYLGTALHEHAVKPEAYPTPHDVKSGGYAAPGYQRFKAEEVRQFFRDFALEVEEFDRRYHPDDLVLIGTDENVKQFLEFLAPPLRDKVVHTLHAPMDAPAAEILDRLDPFFREQMRRQQAEAVELLQDRVRQRHLAVAGLPDTLEQIQEGKVGTLLIARDAEAVGAQCTRCGFYLPRPRQDCPYCGSSTRTEVDVVEALIRLAEEQDLPIEFVEPRAMADLNGVGGLLKF